MSQLFESLKIGGLQLDNRIIIAPMCQYSASEGTPGDWYLIHLGHLALSGAGLLIVEATAVSPEGRITPWDLGLYSDANEEGLARVLGALRANSPIKIGMQLAHAGRRRRAGHLGMAERKYVRTNLADGRRWLRRRCPTRLRRTLRWRWIAKA